MPDRAHAARGMRTVGHGVGRQRHAGDAARGRGFLAYLTKPLDVVQLLAVLDAQLDSRG